MNIKLFSILFLFVVHAESECAYRSKREKLIRDELEMSVGGKIVLDQNETSVNEVLMRWKHQELDQGFDSPHYFNFSQNYFQYKDAIRYSRVYEFIRSMPKGAALHIHGTALLGPDYYLNITYRDHLYVCFGTEIQFKFAYTPPKDACETQWKLMRDVRKSVNDVAKFDLELRSNFTLVETDLRDGGVWKRFKDIFTAIRNLWTHRPLWEEYIYDLLKELRKDNVMYVEIRSYLPQLYELDGGRHDEVHFTNITKSVVQRFVRDYPDFLGAKMIYSFSRNNNAKSIEDQLRLTIDSRRMFPDFVAGFDLVGREDLGGTLEAVLPQLKAASSDLDYFFHAGETNQYGTTDENLIDAVLLKAKRIGHAYALPKHPLILEEVRKNNIGLEVNLLSNQILGLVHDMRNHPLALFLSLGLPVVLSSDDPGLWDAAPLSTDFYVGFMGVASRSHDLRLLKQLALNSIEYSALTDKNEAYAMFDSQWTRFINTFIIEDLF